MKTAVTPSFVRDLDALYQVGALGSLSDRELIARFCCGHDTAAERAFETIVHRHGPMVRGVCRRTVRDEPTAEDAFQATFLVLAMKAGSIRRQESLGPWLHGVAARIGRRARARAARRAQEAFDPVCLARVPAETGKPEVETAELRAVLDEEIERLPAAYRRAIVLCYLEGKTQDAAALELGWSKGTVSGRLARAKELLRVRLTRRGFAPTAGLTGFLVASADLKAAVPTEVARRAVRTGLSAILGGAEVIAASGTVAKLASEALRNLMLAKLTAAITALAVVFAVASTIAQMPRRPERAGGDPLAGKQTAIRPKPSAPTLPQHARARLGTTRLRHEDYTSSVVFAPDGRTLASTGWDGTVRFWDLKTGEPAMKRPRIEGAGRHLSIAYSPDGTKLAVGREAVLQVWDLSTGIELYQSPPQKGGVREILFSPDGKTLATATEEADPAVRMWDVATGHVRRALTFDEPLTYRGRPMCFSPDGKRLAVGATAAADAKKAIEVIGIWNLEANSKPVIIRNAVGRSLTSVTFAANGEAVISGGCDSRPTRELRHPVEKLNQWPTIRVWNASTGRLVHEFDTRGLDGHCAVTMSRDGRTLISLHPDRWIVWDYPSAKVIRTIPIERHDPGIGIGGCMAVSPDGRTVAASRGDHTVHLWDLETGKPFLEQVGAHEAKVTSAAVAPDGRLVVTGDDRGTIALWDAARGDFVRQVDLGEHGFVRSVRFAPDGRTLAAAAMYFDPEAFLFRGIVRLWEMPGGALQREFRLDEDPVQLAFSPDGQQFAISLVDAPNPPGRPRAAGKVDGIQVLDIATGVKRIGLRPRRGPVFAMAFSADSKTFASVEADMRFRFWNLETGQTIRAIPIEGHRQGAGSRQPGGRTSVRAADLTPDLSIAVTGAMSDDQLLVWDLAAGRAFRTFHVETYREAALALSPDGRLLAAALKSYRGKGSDTTIRIWEIATKREVLRLEPKSSAVTSLAFSRDGKTLVSGMADTTVIIWDCSAADKTPANPRN